MYHPQKPGQFRALFYSSAQFKGLSFNSVLLSKPDLTNNLLHVLLRSRIEPVVISDDIQQMFHSFLVEEKHRKYLRFLYRDNAPSNSLIEYRMKYMYSETGLLHLLLTTAFTRQQESVLRNMEVMWKTLSRKTFMWMMNWYPCHHHPKQMTWWHVLCLLSRMKETYAYIRSLQIKKRWWAHSQVMTLQRTFRIWTLATTSFMFSAD